MKLGELAEEIAGAALVGDGNVEVSRVSDDSRRAATGDLFVAVRGEHVDAHRFVPDATQRGAAVAVESPAAIPEGASGIVVTDARAALGRLAAAVLGHPSRRMRLVGVTGTDGKTTVVHMTAHVLSAAGLRTGLLSTISTSSGLTTPGAVEVQSLLAAMVEEGDECGVIEVSSHALVQQRVAGCDFDIAGFTNIGHDHLDYHRTWEAYVEAKATLIDLCRDSAPKGIAKTAVLNGDDASYRPLLSHPIDRRLEYSTSREADVYASDIRLAEDRVTFSLGHDGKREKVSLRMPALFNVSNALCTGGICLALGLSLEDVARGLGSFEGAPGRLQRIDLGQPFTVLVDYAHSASSLESVLKALRPSTRGTLVAVFGSTARSDHDREGMGRAASLHADRFLITTDDPVDEDPAEIASQVAAGAHGGRYEVVLDRRQAIRRALAAAGPGDTVLLAGKGHEKFMMFQGRRREPWDERAEAEAALRELGYGTGRPGA